MNIEIRLGRSKRDSKIFVDGNEVTRGLLDYDVDLMGDLPSVMLKIWPQKLTISGELGEVQACELCGGAYSRSLRRLSRRWPTLLLWRLSASSRSASNDMAGIASRKSPLS